MEDLKRKFNEDMLKQHHIRTQRGYNATLIENSLNKIGGYETAKRFIPKTINPTKGFMNLVERGLLGFSIESLVVQPEYSSLFTEQERGNCMALLEAYGYEVPRQQPPARSHTSDDAPSKITYTAEQQAFFDFIRNGSGNGIIDAVAGSGKTTTIIESSRYIPEHSTALFCAFNKSISTEINEKLKHVSSSPIVAKTIHALGRQILRKHCSNIITIDDKYSQLLNSAEIKSEFSEYYDRLSIGEPNKENYRYKINETLLDMINKYRLTVVKSHDEFDYDEFTEMVTHYGILRDSTYYQDYFEMVHTLLKYGNEQARELQHIDFSDMLYLPCIWGLTSPNSYDFIFVDECQDLSKAQLFTVLKFMNDDSRVIAVGDPFQAINGFAGADTESFKRVSEMFKAASFPLTVCFRCPDDVISLAKNIRHDIKGINKIGKVTPIDYCEALDIAKPGDLIISRRKAPLIQLMFIFIDKGLKVKFRLEDATEILSKLRGYFNQPELNENLHNSNADIDSFCEGVIKRNTWIIEKKVERMSTTDKNKQEVLRVEKWQLTSNIKFIIMLYHEWQTATIRELLERLFDDITSEQVSIKLSSIHCAKGLEADRVFIINYPELPFSWPGILPWQVEQETNLKYVALTRAKQELYLVNCEKNNKEEEKLKMFNAVPVTTETATKFTAVNTFDVNSVKISTKVIHEKFGHGIVEQFKNESKIIIVSFEGSETMFEFPGVFQQGILMIDNSD